jgi:hypothetical protein
MANQDVAFLEGKRLPGWGRTAMWRSDKGGHESETGVD